MQELHLANTFFEKELQGGSRSLKEWFHSHEAVSQLQFLPLLYRRPGQKVFVSEPPPQEYLSHLKSLGFAIDGIETAPKAPFTLDLWGASEAAAAWAKAQGGVCLIPNFDLVKEVHSKLYAFAIVSPQIPHSRLVKTPEEAEEWSKEVKGPKVLKQAFGLSGSGHLLFEEKLPAKALQLLKRGEILIAEPWVKRLFDFSTQWKIDREINYLGATLLQVSAKGIYKATLAGDEQLLFEGHLGALQQHIDGCKPLLNAIYALGFFGNLGIDAFVYEWEGKKRLQIASELNARKTMGWAALEIQRLHFPQKTLHLRYEESNKVGFLPQKLGTTQFHKQLFLEVN